MNKFPTIYYDPDTSIVGMTTKEADKAGVPKGFPKELITRPESNAFLPLEVLYEDFY